MWIALGLEMPRFVADAGSGFPERDRAATRGGAAQLQGRRGVDGVRLWDEVVTGRIARRRLVGGALVASAVGVAGCSVSGGAGHGGSAPPKAATPTTQNGATKLLVAVGYQGGSQFPGTMQALVDAYIARYWTSKHPGVSVTTTAGGGSNGPNMGAAAEIASSLAGQPEDVITGCCGDWYTFLNANMFRPLASFIKQDNVDLSVFSPGHLAGLTTAQGVMALPEYDGPQVVAVNLEMLDGLGISLPSENWDYTEAEALWRKIAGYRKGQAVTGIDLTRFPDPWVAAGWGGVYGNSEGTQCFLDDPKVVAAWEWFLPLVWSKVIGGGHFKSGQTAMKTQAGWDIEGDLLGWSGIKWKYYPMPRWPAGPSTFINNDFYAINSYSKNPPDLVWSIYKFLVLDSGFQELMWKTTFITPNRIDLWPSWERLIKAVAPPMVGKNIEAMAASVKFGHSHYFWKYEDPTAEGIVGTYFKQIAARQVSVKTGLHQATQQVNALQAASATAYTKEATFAKQTSAQVAAAEAGKRHPFTPPAKAGVGSAATAAGKLVTAAGGTYTLLGNGEDLWGGSDNGVFACTSSTATKGTYVARLDRIANVDCPHLSQWAKVGLMARSDLSNDAAYVAVLITGEHGVQVQSRAAPLANTIGQGATAKEQLAAALTLPNKTAAPNYLKKPVWLRLVRDVNLWTAATSSDGKKWVTAGAPLKLEMAGVWLGVFATSHNSSKGFKAGQEIQAVFDKLTFAPATFVQIGSR